MKYPATAVALSILGLGCTDKPESAASPTAPPSVAASASVARPAGSTICLAYQGEQARLAAAVEKAPVDKRLQSQLDAVESMVKDACN